MSKRITTAVAVIVVIAAIGYTLKITTPKDKCVTVGNYGQTVCTMGAER